MRGIHRFIGRLTLCAALAASLLAPGKAVALAYYYHFDNTFSGSSPAGPGPWMDALFADVAPGKVSLTISTAGLVDDEFLGAFYFNLKPGLLATSLTLTPTAYSSGFSLPAVSKGVDAFKADGDGKYDVLLSFGTANGVRFGAGDYITYLITGIPTLSAADFQYLSQPAGGHGPFLAAAHVQGIMCETESSGWISPNGFSPVPEPSTICLGLLAGGACLWRRRAG